jgi:agmatinase
MEFAMYSFLEEDIPPAQPEAAQFHIIPVAFEASVSYGKGTANGPQAIINASQQLELFDGISCDAALSGIYTAPAMECCGDAEMILSSLKRSVSSVLMQGKLPVVLGGEHTITDGVVEALTDFHDEFGIIQFDAHADLRDQYGGSKFSHASVMRRVHERGVPIFQVGTRAVSEEEQLFRSEQEIPYLDARDLYGRDKQVFSIPKGFPKKVYVTIDVDGLDPSVIRSTGTPVPGGIGWYDILHFLETVVTEHDVVGFDCVELAPTEEDHASTFAAAQLIYNFMGMIARKNRVEE